MASTKRRYFRNLFHTEISFGECLYTGNTTVSRQTKDGICFNVSFCDQQLFIHP